MTEVVHAENVVKTLGRVRVLEKLNLSVRKGEVHGLLGPAGSGRTTVLRTLLGLLRPDEGTIRLLDGDPWKDSVRLHRRLAYVPSDAALWPGLSGGEVSDLLCKLRGKPILARRDELVERFGLDPTRKTRTYSPEERQKTLLVSAFAGDTELLLLDEPSRHLDERSEAVLRDCVGRARERGTAVLLTSGRLPEVRDLCDRVSVLRSGSVVGSGVVSGIPGLTRLSVTAALASVPDGLTDLPGVHHIKVSGTGLRCQVDPGDVGTLLRRLGKPGLEDITVRPVTLDEFLTDLRPSDGVLSSEAT